MKTIALWAAVSIAGTCAAGGATLTGEVTVVDGDTIVVEGRELNLYGIKAPELGNHCTVGSLTIDCGKISRSALLDLTAGAKVICKPAPDSANGLKSSAICQAGGYDLSEGMTYTGWARADTEVTDHYLRFERDARRNHRGLWRQAKDD